MLCGVILGLLKYLIGVVLFCVLVNTYLVCFDLILILVHCKFVLSCRVRKTAGSDRYANVSSSFLTRSACVHIVHWFVTNAMDRLASGWPPELQALLATIENKFQV